MKREVYSTTMSLWFTCTSNWSGKCIYVYHPFKGDLKHQQRSMRIGPCLISPVFLSFRYFITVFPFESACHISAGNVFFIRNGENVTGYIPLAECCVAKQRAAFVELQVNFFDKPYLQLKGIKQVDGFWKNPKRKLQTHRLPSLPAVGKINSLEAERKGREKERHRCSPLWQRLVGNEQRLWSSGERAKSDSNWK